MEIFFHTTKENIENWLNTHNIINYRLVADDQFGYVVDVDGSVDLLGKSLTEIPVKFNRIRGDFICSYNMLEDLKFAPLHVSRDFDCSSNMLENIKDSPQSVGGDFNCSHNSLVSLEGCPREVAGDFDCSENFIKNLLYFPQMIGGDIKHGGNKLNSEIVGITSFNNLTKYHILDKESFKLLGSDFDKNDIKVVDNIILENKEETDWDMLKIALSKSKDSNEDRKNRILPLDLLKKDQYGKTVLYYVLENKNKSIKLSEQDWDFLLRNSNLSDMDFPEKWNILMVCLINNKTRELNLTSKNFDYLFKQTDFKYRSEKGWTPAMVMLKTLKSEELPLTKRQIMYVLENSDLNFQNINGDFVLMMAMWKFCEKIEIDHMDLLFKNTDFSLKNNDGWNALFFALLKKRDGELDLNKDQWNYLVKNNDLSVCDIKSGLSIPDLLIDVGFGDIFKSYLLLSVDKMICKEEEKKDTSYEINSVDILKKWREKISKITNIKELNKLLLSIYDFIDSQKESIDNKEENKFITKQKLNFNKKMMFNYFSEFKSIVDNEVLESLNKNLKEKLGIKTIKDIYKFKEGKMLRKGLIDFYKTLEEKDIIIIQEKINEVENKFKLNINKTEIQNESHRKLILICSEIEDIITKSPDMLSDSSLMKHFNDFKNKIDNDFNSGVDSFLKIKNKLTNINADKENVEKADMTFDGFVQYFFKNANELKDKFNDNMLMIEIINFSVNQIIEKIQLDDEKINADMYLDKKEDMLSVNKIVSENYTSDVRFKDLNFYNYESFIKEIMTNNGFGLHEYQIEIIKGITKKGIPRLLNSYVELKSKISKTEEIELLNKNANEVLESVFPNIDDYKKKIKNVSEVVMNDFGKSLKMKMR